MPAQKSRFILPFILLITTALFSQVNPIEETEDNDKKVEELGYFIETSIHESNNEGYISKFDLDDFGKKITKMTNDDKEQYFFSQGFLKGLLEGIDEYPKKLSAHVENGGYYDFISYRYESEAKTYYMLFRFFSEESGVNYHDYRVVDNNGEFKFSDLYIYLSGEHLSDTFSRMYMTALPKNKLAKFVKGDYFGDYEKFTEAVNLNRSGKPAKAYKVLNSIKGELANEKFLLLIKIQISYQLDDESYIASIEELKEKHNNDPTMYLTLVDYYILKEEYDRAFDLIDNLQIETNDDFLYYMKGNVEFLSDDYESASNYYAYIIENYPDFFQGYAGYLIATTKQQKYDDAITVLNKLVELEYDKDAIIEYLEEDDETGINVLEDLVKSDAYKTWKG